MPFDDVYTIILVQFQVYVYNGTLQKTISKLSSPSFSYDEISQSL